MHLGKIALSLALLAGAAQLAAAQPRGVIIQRQAIPLPGKAVSRVATPSETDTPDAPTIVPGKWDIKYHWKGVLTSVWGFDDGTQGQRSVAWADDGSNVAEAGGRVLPEDYPGAGILEINAASYITTGTVTVVCAWVPNLDGYDPPPLNPQAGPAPKTLTLREIPYALAHQETNTTSSADDGMGDAATLGNNVLTSQSAGHLTTHAVTNNKVTITHAMSAQTNLNYDWDWQDVQLSYKVVEDTRTVRLYRPGAINETVDADGTTHGDSVYSYNLLVDGRKGSQAFYPNDQLFHSSLGGGWSQTWTGAPNVDFSWSMPLTEMGYNLYTNTGEAPNGTAYQFGTFFSAVWGGTPDAPKPYTIGYHVQDNNDGAVADAKYILTLHDEIENAQDSVWNVTASTPAWGSDTSRGGNYLEICSAKDADVPAGTFSVAQGHAETKGWNVYTEFAPAYFQQLFQLNLGAGYTDTNDNSWQSTVTYNKVLKAHYYVYPVLNCDYKRHYITFRHFQPAGEHILHETHGAGYDTIVLHHDTVDVYIGSGIGWSDPTPVDTLYPEYDPAQIPRTPLPNGA